MLIAVPLPGILKRFAVACFVVPGMILSSFSGAMARPVDPVDIIVDESLSEPAAYGLGEFIRVLERKGYDAERTTALAKARSSHVIVIGTLRSKNIRSFVRSGALALSDVKESLSVKRLNAGKQSVLAIAGADERGLMYALLEAAREVDAAADKPAVDAITEVAETPLVPVRSMAVFLHNEDDEREWYYSREYWEDYFGMLAANRWNTFNLVFSHQTSYLAPMYPFHVTVKEYPEVRANLSEAQRVKNLETLRMITTLAKERGIDFTLGIWQQIAWETSEEVEGQESMVSGYNKENMTGYTYLALKQLLRECPGITGLQLRMNYESGVTFDRQTEFFRDAIFRAAKESGRDILIELRDIGLLSETREAAQTMGLRTRISHKYWAEDMVFPYHPTKFVWTYSYGDWLKYPRNADQIYQVWSLGSHRLLLWGDPEFAKRFAPTTRFGEAVGFEICAPLSQKGFGNAPGAWRIFRDPSREYYRWEFERYWSYYQLLGRLTYNPARGHEFWTQELVRRFGQGSAPALAKAYESASHIVPHIVAVAISNFNMYVWPEQDNGGLLNYYMTLRPFDRALFAGFDEHAENILAGRSSGKLSPADVAARLDSIAAVTVAALEHAKGNVERGEKEFWATDKDFRILAGMAKYFAQKMRAALALTLYYKTGDVNQLDGAIDHAEQGLAEWKAVAAIAGEIYRDNLVFGPGSAGHWKDKIAFAEDDLKQLRYQRMLFEAIGTPDFAFDFGPVPFTRNTETYSTPYVNNYTVERRFTGVFPNSRYDPQLGYGWVEGDNLKASVAKDLTRYTWSGATAEEVKNIPSEALMGDYIMGSGEAVFRVDLPEGHYQGTVILTDKSANPSDHGPMEVFVVERFGDRPIVDSHTVRVGETIIKRFNINMTGERFINFRVKFRASAPDHFIINALTFTRVEPHIAHVPVHRAQPGLDLRVAASVTLPPPPNDGHPLTSLGIITSNASTLAVPKNVTRVTLKYSSDRYGTFKSVVMGSSGTGSYVTTLPGAGVREGRLYYYFEAEDNTGRIVRLPMEEYFETDVTGDVEPPVVTHTTVAAHSPNTPLEIRARVKDNSAVDKVLLYFRPTRQTMEYTTLEMSRNGDEFVAVIPGSVITKDFDLMYYLEAFDEHGNACIRPDRETSDPYFLVKVKR